MSLAEGLIFIMAVLIILETSIIVKMVATETTYGGSIVISDEESGYDMYLSLAVTPEKLSKLEAVEFHVVPVRNKNTP